MSMENFQMKRLFAAAAIFTLALDCAQGASMLSEQQARAKAIGILKGDPYGKTDAEVAKDIKQARLLQNANSKACGGKATAWEFHVVVVTPNKDQFNNGVIDGYLAIDPRTGKMLCANLPLLD
jgi:hypothetical protein